MGIEEILKLIESVQQTDIQELEVSSGEWKVRLVRIPPPSGTPYPNGDPAAIPSAASASSDPGIPPSPNPSEESSTHSYIEVTSPMVGTFYRAPEPGIDPFVNENDVVVPGQTMCIIEAMKLMNEIPSEIKGRIVDILVENAQPVEFDQPLFLLDPV